MTEERGLETAQFDRILANPKYHELVTKRRRFAWLLSIVMLILYYTFILLIAFRPEILAAPFGVGIITVGIPVGAGIIVAAFILTWIYIVRANGLFDKLTSEIKEMAK
ncbi:MAG: DUF485 domain-containing protein [Magnetococcales bacterium]|nr:DUF485 domain-containing protein [Magnetococcales bacterium]MBF0321388.1 DUF485 domain-containing protein [Magnetococcales bacterium]